MPFVQEQDRLFAAVHSLRGKTALPGTHNQNGLMIVILKAPL